ncbi:MAG: hypothetical protein P4M00_18080 [Azospirillaceae bacterium]|nr:hypothetical protein [Azospirillaceae bacterium]
MITWDDCIGLSPFENDEVYAIAAHERLPAICALEKAMTMINQPWGDASVRQMIWDSVRLARDQGNDLTANRLMVVYRRACVSHNGTVDRRTDPNRRHHAIVSALH